MGYSLRATKIKKQHRESYWDEEKILSGTDGYAEVVTKESPDTQRIGYGMGVAKTDSDFEGRVGQAPAHSGRAMKMNDCTEVCVRRSKALTPSGWATV